MVFVSRLPFRPFLSVTISQSPALARGDSPGVDSIILNPAEHSFELKAALRKPSEQTTTEQIEEDIEGYCISSVENQLSGKEEIVLKEILYSDPKKQKIFELYNSTVLKPDLGLTYSVKNRLKKGFLENRL